MQTKTIWIINQYASTPETGMGGRHFHLARELAKQGHKVYLVAASYTHILRQPPKVKASCQIQLIEGIHFVWLKMPCYSNAHSKKRIINWFLFAWKLRGLINTIADKPDTILYSSPSLIGFLGSMHIKNVYKNTRLVFEVRDIWPLTLIQVGGYSANNLFIRFLQWIEDKAYRDSESVISNLKNAVEHMVSRGMDRSKFTWIPNGFSMDEVKQKQDLPESVLTQLPKDKFVIGYTGTLGIANALESLIEAAEILKEQTAMAFVLVGEGKEKARLKELVKAKGLINIYFIDAIPKAQIQSILSFFDVCFLGLTKDPLFKFGVSPNKLMDYFYSGKPIVYAIESGSYTPVADACAGIQVNAEDSQAIADAVLELKQLTQVARDALGDNGKHYALKNHEYSALAKKLENVLVGEQ